MRTLYFTTTCAALMLPTQANTIIQETFAYTLGTVSPDADAASGQPNGLPFDNTGGLPVGSGTGLLSNWGANTIVVPGLNYPGLASTNNALRHTGTSWQDGAVPYRFMGTDPYLSFRVGGLNDGLFGADGTTLYFSYLFSVADVSKVARFAIGNNSIGNVFIGLNSAGSGGAVTIAYNQNSAGLFEGTTTGPGVNINNGQTNLVVGKLVSGAAGGPDEITLWINPDMSVFDGTETPSLVSTTTAGSVLFQQLKFNSDTADNLTFDEFRLGTALADVTPAAVGPDVTPPAWAAGFPKSDSITTSSLRLRLQVDDLSTAYYVVLPDGATAPTAAQIKLGQDSTGNPVSAFGSQALAANTIGNLVLSGLNPSTSYDVYLVAEDLVLNQTAPLLFNVTTASSAGSLIINESFDYTIGTSDPDPDGGLNAGQGLPATNVGGLPAGTSTGLRNSWGTDLNVVAGLTYPGLLTSGGAANATTAAWGASTVFAYRFMTTDPFANLRVGNSFGLDGQSLYFSMLAQTSSDADSAWRLKITGTPDQNTFLRNAGTGGNSVWTLDNNGPIASSGASVEINTPTLLLLRIDFVAGAGDVYSLWVNPSLDTDDLGAPDASITIAVDFVFNRLQTRSAVAGAMTFDEIRMGTSISSVLPSDVVPPGGYASWATTNGVTGGVSGDSDNDGILNSVEYALNTNLTGSDGSVGTFTGGTLSFTKRPAAIANGDVTYVIETSPSLATGSWTPQVTQNPGNADTSITYALPTGQGKIFGRLKVLVNP